MGREDFINVCFPKHLHTESYVTEFFGNQSIANNTKLHIPDLNIFNVNGVGGAAKDPSREFLWKLLSPTHDGLI